MKKSSDKIGFLLKYLKGELSEKELPEVGSIIESDKELSEMYPIIRNLHAAGRKIKWEQVRRSALRLSLRLYDDFQKSRKMTSVRYGVRVFDSGLLPLPEGVRPAIVDTRRIKYKIGEGDLEISLYPVSTDSYEVIGRVSQVACQAPLKVMLKSPTDTYTVEADQFNLFRFVRIPVSSYTLYILAGKRKVGAVGIEI